LFENRLKHLLRLLLTEYFSKDSSSFRIRYLTHSSYLKRKHNVIVISNEISSNHV